MKWSQTSPDMQAERGAYVEARWAQFHDSYTSWTEEALKYLLAVNTAGMAGALSFMAALPQLRALAWPKMVLFLFAGGLVSVGLYHVARHHRTRWLFKCWRESVARYKADEIQWNDLLDVDQKCTDRFTLPLDLLSHGSLILFLFGLAVAGWNLNDITKQPLKESTQDERTQSATTATPAAPRASTRATGLRHAPADTGRPAARKGDSKGADTGPR